MTIFKTVQKQYGTNLRTEKFLTMNEMKNGHF